MRRTWSIQRIARCLWFLPTRLNAGESDRSGQTWGRFALEWQPSLHWANYTVCHFILHGNSEKKVRMWNGFRWLRRGPSIYWPAGLLSDWMRGSQAKPEVGLLLGGNLPYTEQTIHTVCHFILHGNSEKKKWECEMASDGSGEGPAFIDRLGYYQLFTNTTV
jgi:hypothetical protein